MLFILFENKKAALKRRPFLDVFNLEFADHVSAAAKRRFNHTVFIWALGYLNFAAVFQRDVSIFKRRVALSAGSVNAHSADFAFISRHL